MHKLFIWLLILPGTISFHSFAQNLVPDPDFERMQKEPRKNRNGINCTRYWSNAVLTGGDYYNSIAGRDFFGVGVPRNIFGYQKAHSGDGYAGICIEKNMVEYVETKLLYPLIKGQRYRVEFFISRAEHRLGSVKEFGAMFLEKTVWSLPATGIKSKPQVEFIQDKGFKNTKDWICLSGEYVAEGGESVIVVGHFNHQYKVKGKSHYYIDDVSVLPINEIKTTTQKDTLKQLMEVEETNSFSPSLNQALVLNNLFFESNESKLLPESFPELNSLVDYLNNHRDQSILICGYTDQSGNENENMSLSRARAKSVADYLILKNIPENRIKSEGRGSKSPIANNETEEGRKQNRRVEIVLSKNSSD